MLSLYSQCLSSLSTLWCKPRTVLPIILAVYFSANAYALGRIHEYIVYVVNNAGQPVSDISVSTKSVHGYDQSSASCTTSTNGRCSLNFSAFAPSSTFISIVLEGKNKEVGQSRTLTLLPVKNSLFKNNDSTETKIIFDEEAIIADRRAEADKAIAHIKAQEELIKLEREAVHACIDKESCEKAFALAEIFLSKVSDMKIQTATGTTVETYNPTKTGEIGLRALKTPGKGSSASIRLTVLCKDAYVDGRDICIEKKIAVYREFRPFMTNATAD